MSETHDPWKDVKPFKLMLLSDLQSGATEAALYHASEVDAARAAEATQHQQDRRRWAESLKEQHQRHVIESDALRKVLAAWEITANERSARLATLRAERDRLKAAAQAVLDNGPCADPDCCTMAIKHEAALQTLRAALSGEGTKP